MDGQKQYQNDIANAIKKHIKENPAEYGAPEGTDEVDETSSPTSGKGEIHQTEASAYAAENRKRHRDEELGYISGGLDKVLSGFGAIGSGLKAVFETVGDMISDLPVGKEMILGTFILVLLASNIYTYFAFKGRAPERLARKQGRENDLSEVIRLLLEQSGGGHKVIQGEHGRGHAQPRREYEELMILLDEVEARTARLRSSVSKAGDDVRHLELD